MRSRCGVLFVFFAVFFTISFIVPQTAFGQIVPCGNRVGPGSTLECSVCHLQVLAMNVLNFIVSTSVLVAALLFLHAGILYVLSSANSGNIARAHRIFTTTLIGLILILSAWLIVNIIMSTFYNTAQFGRWDRVLCVPSETTGPTPPPQQPPTGDPSAPPPSETGTLSEAEARAALEGRVGIWESRPGATTFDGVRQTTIDGVLWMSEDSGLNSQQMIITGAVDAGGPHADGTYSHGNGYKIDFDDTPEMNSYIESTFTHDGYRGSDPRYVTTINGRPVEAVRERTHWDVTFR